MCQLDAVQGAVRVVGGGIGVWRGKPPSAGAASTNATHYQHAEYP